MKNRLCLLFMMTVYALSIFSIKAENAPFRVVGYFVNWYNTKAYARTFDYSQVTHLNYAFVNIASATGELEQPGSDLDTLVARAHARNVKVLASLGGGSQTSNTKKWYNDIMLTTEGRALFSHKILLFINKYKLDGFDIDLEGDLIKKGYYDAFIQTLSDSLKSKDKLLTAALNGDGSDNMYNTTLAYFDWINIMSYDFTGAWTPDNPGQHASFEHAVLGVTNWSARGVKKENLCVGVPFYAHAFLTDIGMDYKNYNEILPKYPYAYQQDTVGHMIYYNGIPTIKQKTNMALERAGGIMIWALQYDVTGSKSLLKAIDEAVKSYNKDNKAPVPTIVYPTKDTTQVIGNIDVLVKVTDADGNFMKNNVYVNGVLTATGTNPENLFNLKNLSAGKNILIIESLDEQYKAGYDTIAVTVTNGVARSAFNNTPMNIPGIIEAENYDVGGPNVTFYDATPGNSGLKYRPDAIDIEDCLDATKGYDVGWTASGEWLEYTINVKNKGLYDFEIRTATPNAGRTIVLAVDGTDITNQVALPNTGSWQKWSSTSVKNCRLEEGQHILRAKYIAGNYNINYIRVTASTVDLDQVSATKVTLYPNPATDFINIESNKQNRGITRYEILDLNGKKRVSTTSSGSGSEKETIVVSSLPQGFYLLKSTGEDGKSSCNYFLKN